MLHDLPAMLFKARFILAGAIGGTILGLGGCYYPAKIQPPQQPKTQTVVTVPYDLTWDALHTVVAQHEFRILGDDPNHGIIEADAHSFTLADADCGQLKSVGSRYNAEPDPGGSAVYNFHAEPAGPESTALSVTATYSTPVHVPFHPISEQQCVSRGTQEARLLNEIDITAHSERRPSSKPETPPLGSRRPSLLGPDILKKPKPMNQ